MPSMRDAIIGTAGHIDHGKTTLVKALTGIDTDRLEEEKRRGITIDIGFAHLELDGFRVGFIDVPGHEKFVKNMLAGIGGIDVALLVVAANESVMPQTVEHFEICRLLEIPRGLVAITKKDQADDELLALVEEEIRDLTRGTFMQDGPIVAVDSISGSGISELMQAISAVLEHSSRDSSRGSSRLDPKHDPGAKIFRMPIDRVFTIKGFGTVVTGTPAAGILSKDDTVAVYPSGKTGKVRGIEIFNEPADCAREGQRTALNVSGLEKQDLERGMVLSRPGAFVPSHMLDAVLSLLPRAPRPLKHGSPIRFHHGSAEMIGKVYLLEGREIAPGATGLVQFRLDTPTVSCPRDHFIVRSYSPATTIGGGIILDNSPGKHTTKESETIAPLLHRLASATRSSEGLGQDALASGRDVRAPEGRSAEAPRPSGARTSPQIGSAEAPRPSGARTSPQTGSAEAPRPSGARTSRPLARASCPSQLLGFDLALLDYLVSRAGISGLDLNQLRARTGRTHSALLADLERIDSIVIIRQDPPIAASQNLMAAAGQRAVEQVRSFQAANPLSQGISREELKMRLMPGASNSVFQALLDDLLASRQIQLNAGNVLPFGVQVDLDESQKQIRSSIIARLDENPFQPPSLEELCQELGFPAADVRRVFHFLLARGELVRVTADIVLPARQVDSLKNQLRASFQNGAAFGVAEFKEIFNVSRKYAIPMLEYLDRERVTRRAGDKRILL